MNLWSWFYNNTGLDDRYSPIVGSYLARLTTKGSHWMASVQQRHAEDLKPFSYCTMASNILKVISFSIISTSDFAITTKTSNYLSLEPVFSSWRTTILSYCSSVGNWSKKILSRVSSTLGGSVLSRISCELTWIKQQSFA